MAAKAHSVYQRTQIATADRRKIIVLLYEGVISRLTQARQAIEEHDGDRRVFNVNKALDIINFLTTSLDFERGGEIAHNLEALYAYVRDIVAMGNIENRAENFTEAIRLMSTLLDGWRAIASGSTSATSVLEERTREAVANLAVAG
jgi:flagellar secretion chaperone FliS